MIISLGKPITEINPACPKRDAETFSNATATRRRTLKEDG
jgi:hypothetical protein